MTTKKFTPTIKRGPRLTPGEINVTPPDDLGIDIPASGLQKMLPYVMGGGMLGMIAIMIFTGVRQLSPYMLMMPLMMIMGTVGFMAGGGPGGKKVPEINADRKEYLRYLSGLRTRVTSSAAAQVTFFNYNAPDPHDLLSLMMDATDPDTGSGMSEADGIDNPDPHDFATIQGDPTLKLYPRDAINVFYVGMNNTKGPLANEKVRQAVAMGLREWTRIGTIMTLRPMSD